MYYPTVTLRFYYMIDELLLIFITDKIFGRVVKCFFGVCAQKFILRITFISSENLFKIVVVK